MQKSVQDDRYRAAIEVLHRTRRDTGLSQAALAERIGRRQQFVSKYESLERRLDLIEFIDIATALSLDWQLLITDVLERRPRVDDHT